MVVLRGDGGVKGGLPARAGWPREGIGWGCHALLLAFLLAAAMFSTAHSPSRGQNIVHP